MKQSRTHDQQTQQNADAQLYLNDYCEKCLHM